MSNMIRMLPPNNAQFQKMDLNGRAYSSAPGSTLDVPFFDAGRLEASGWTSVAPMGATAERPTGSGAFKGALFVDTELSKVVIFDGANWRDPITGNAA